jgi:hypothetical protein
MTTISVAGEPDAWVAQGLRSAGGLRPVRLRKICDHEAAHAAMALVLGWYVNRAEVTSEDRGAAECERPPGRDAGQVMREELAITRAARLVTGDRHPSAGDNRDAIDLARRIAGNGTACIAMRRDTALALERADRTVSNAAETRLFRVLHHTIREALEQYGALDARDLAAIFAGATGRRSPSSTPKPKTTASTPTAKRKPTGCRGCGFSYTPHHTSGKCFTCRGRRDG